MATLFAGTSGFAYPTWKPGFYPEDLPARRFLEHYAGRLNSVEINYTFRRTPSATTLAEWARATPSGFAFAMKAHQRITHVRRLKDAEEPTAFFLKSLEPLRAAQRLGPVLFQLPPYLRLDLERLAAFLEILPAGTRSVLEFRHESWFTEDTFRLLRRHDAALCFTDSDALDVPEVVTAGFVYHRLRRPGYGEADLRRLADGARRQLAAGRDVYMVFKHEADAGGALEAERLLALAGPAAAQLPAA
jgi:uncharacterized protein YecE (DUF72 family)